MKVVEVRPNGAGGTVVRLEKMIAEGFKTGSVPNERAYINLCTKNNISFGKGFIVLRHKYHKEVLEEEKK